MDWNTQGGSVGSRSFGVASGYRPGALRIGLVALALIGVATAVRVVPSQIAGASTTSMPAPAGFGTLVWDDQFAGTTLDSTHWVPQMGDPQNGVWHLGCQPSGDSLVGYGTGNNAEFGHPGNVIVNNGLTLHAVPDSSEQGCGGWTWRSGYISTLGKWQFPQGTPVYIQVKAQMPDMSDGAWPSMWLMSDGGANELDFFEGGFLGGPNVPQNQKYAFTDHSSGASPSGSQIVDTGFDMSAGYNTYGLDWDPNARTATLFINGTQRAQVTNINTNVFGYGGYDFIISNTLATGNAAGWHTAGLHASAYDFKIAEVQVWEPGATTTTTTQPTTTTTQPSTTTTTAVPGVPTTYAVSVVGQSVSGSNATLTCGAGPGVVNVVVSENGTKLTEGAPVNGIATLTVSLSAGTHTLTVVGWPTPPGGGGTPTAPVSVTVTISSSTTTTTTTTTPTTTTTTQPTTTTTTTTPTKRHRKA
jgi:hypothetical protein